MYIYPLTIYKTCVRARAKTVLAMVTGDVEKAKSANTKSRDGPCHCITGFLISVVGVVVGIFVVVVGLYLLLCVVNRCNRLSVVDPILQWIAQKNASAQYPVRIPPNTQTNETTQWIRFDKKRINFLKIDIRRLREHTLNAFHVCTV